MQWISQGRFSVEARERRAGVNTDLRTRIELARVILIAAIVFHHIRIPAELSFFTWDNLGYARGYLQIGVFKTATATLTVISGYLLFSSKFELNPIGFLQKKFNTLFVPLLIWNIPGALLLSVLHSNGQYLTKYDNLADGSILNWANALIGLTQESINYPLHFLRNLLACNVIALLVVGIFRKHAIAVFAAIIVIGFFNLEGSLVTRDDILMGFFLGGFAASTAIDHEAVDFMLPVSMPGFLVSAFVMFYWEINYDSTWGMLHRLLSFLAVWPFIGYLSRSNFGRTLASNSNYAFFVFLSHYYVSLLLFAVCARFIDMQHFYVYFLLAGPLTIGICILLQRGLKWFAPLSLAIATGGRAA